MAEGNIQKKLRKTGQTLNVTARCISIQRRIFIFINSSFVSDKFMLGPFFGNFVQRNFWQIVDGDGPAIKEKRREKLKNGTISRILIWTKKLRNYRITNRELIERALPSKIKIQHILLEWFLIGGQQKFAPFVYISVLRFHLKHQSFCNKSFCNMGIPNSNLWTVVIRSSCTWTCISCRFFNVRG